MEIRELAIRGSFEVIPRQFRDDRGAFLEQYRADDLAGAVGHPLHLRQVNTSISHRGVVRGIHYADVPRGQAKYVSVAHGAIIDFVVDIRIGSPTFGTWASVRLDDVERRSLYLAEGLGHAFVALTDNATVTYLVSEVYRPESEHGINPMDSEIALNFDLPAHELIFSEKDALAPGLTAAATAGLLPRYDECLNWYATLDGKG